MIFPKPPQEVILSCSLSNLDFPRSHFSFSSGSARARLSVTRLNPPGLPQVQVHQLNYKGGNTVAATGLGRFILLSGPPNSGKTRVLLDLVERKDQAILLTSEIQETLARIRNLREKLKDQRLRLSFLSSFNAFFETINSLYNWYSSLSEPALSSSALSSHLKLTRKMSSQSTDQLPEWARETSSFPRFIFIDGITLFAASLSSQAFPRYKTLLLYLKHLTLLFPVIILMTNHSTYDGRPWNWQFHQHFTDIDLLLSRKSIERWQIDLFMKRFMGRFESEEIASFLDLLESILDLPVVGTSPSQISIRSRLTAEPGSPHGS